MTDQINIQFDLGNDGFRHSDTGDINLSAIADIVRGIAARIELGHSSGTVVDTNGNTVGQYAIETGADGFGLAFDDDGFALTFDDRDDYA